MPAGDNSRAAARVSAAKLALAVRRLRADKENLDLLGSDPIAIIGMGCRFPGGAESPKEFWAALAEGRDCVGEIPAGRWKDADSLEPRMRQGGYLSEIDAFDAAYFGISPREAQHMDPQQRLLLEVCWEALWDAGIEPGTLAGTDTGVFVAIYNSDYARLHFRDASLLTAHAGIGAAHSVAAGRLSFLLNIQGPSLALDSACSSSLVATHLACQSLRTGECGVALVAASSLKLLSDEVQVFSKWGMLASDGRCKTFDAVADGFVPGEGSGVLVLKRLSDALEDGDRVRAVIRGTAVNHDGKTTVLTAPNGLAQEEVLRAALGNAMLAPGDVSYIETHGTGTSLGDPIEMEAIGNVYGATGPDVLPCVLGAVKTNVGHLEASAGIAGLIKTVLCLEHGEIPKNLHFERLNPEISLEGSRLKIATENVPWKRSEVPRVAGVSSFGLGGTNGHILVEEAPLVPARANARAIPLRAYEWQRRRFWLAEPPVEKVEVRAHASTAGFVHPLLGRRVDSAFVQGALFEADLNTASVPYLAEHRLGERALVPFAAFLEMAAAAVRESGRSGPCAIRNFQMQEARFVSTESCRVQVLVGEGSVEIASESKSSWKINAKGTTRSADEGFAAKTNKGPAAPGESGGMDVAGLRGRCARKIFPREIYEGLEKTGLRYDASFRTIEAAWAGSGESLAHLRLPENLAGEAGRYGLHPVLLDGCLQTVGVARGRGNDELFLPIGVDAFELRRAGMAEVWVHTRITSSSGETLSADLTIADAAGAVVAMLAGFTAKRTSAEFVQSLADASEPVADGLTYEMVWRARPLVSSHSASAVRGERWLLIEGDRGSLRELAELLTQRGASCEIVRGMESMGAARARWTGVVYDARSGDAGDAEHPEKDAVDFVLGFAKFLDGSDGAAPKLRVITSSTVAVLPGEDVTAEQAPLRGMVRTLALEYPETSPMLIDVAGGDGSVETGAMLAAEIASGGVEPMVSLRHNVRYVQRLVRSVAHGDAMRKLQIGSSGLLEDLRFAEAERGAPEAHEVEIRVRAAGLNFRDVLTALGMLPARASTLGGECAGTIVRVGGEVEGWRIGDEVLAFAPGSFQNFVNVDAEFVTRKPADMTFADAAGIPIAFLTAHYGLERLAKLSAGHSILIHAAAGGLGLAAVELAMRAGARVFATAGSAEKREFLRRRGVEHVFDSRSVAFRDEVLAATGGVGMDVVLNSLAGDFIRASFDVVGEGGCFLEVGKRGIWSAAEVAALGKNIRYFPYDLGDVAMENPALIAGMLKELMQRFSTGELRPLPTALYAFENATDAFRTMAQARHIGKIVLGLEGGEQSVSLGDLLSDGTVLITGGLGALGIETARWLAAEGARNIVLAGRHVESGEEHGIAAELRGLGVDVAMERVDVANASQVEMLLEKIRATRPPLRAVFHAAGVVQDSVLGKESWESYCEATAAKIVGAKNFDRLTRKDAVRLMIFFSSASSILGSPGQGNYAAGNAYLDALAHHRTSRGLRTVSVNWGAWASAGMAARLSAEQALRWTRQGAKPMEPADALAACGRAIESGRAQVAIMDLNWERFLGEGARRDAAIFSELREVGAPQRDGAENTAKRDSGVLEMLSAAAAAERTMILSAHVKACARRVLGLDDAAAIEDSVPLQDIGLDSLMALELRNELAQSLGLTLPAGLLFDYPSVEQATEHLLGLLEKLLESDEVEECSTVAVDLLSEEDAERMLIEELDRAEREKANA